MGATTRLTSIYGTFFLVSLVIAGALERRVSKRHVAVAGALGARLAFGTLIAGGVVHSLPVFYAGVVMLGLAIGLATISNLSLMLDMTRAGQVGLFIGAWGMADAFARLVGDVLGGVVRDVVTHTTQNGLAGYLVVFGLEVVMLGASLLLLRRISPAQFHSSAAEAELPLAERAAIANGA